MRNPFALTASALALATASAWAQQQPAPATNAPTQTASAAAASTPAQTSSTTPSTAPATTPAAPLTRTQLWAACVNVAAAQQALDTCSQIIQGARESDINIGIAFFNRANANLSLS